jgi:tetratricopeptide (TPR) repeat protein
MLEVEVSEEDLARIPRMTPDCDPTALPLSPAEGFLLSRIDGQTSWKVLRDIGGLTSDEVDVRVEEWLAQGIIDIDGRPPRVERRKQTPAEKLQSKPGTSSRKKAIDESLIDDSLEIKVDVQRELLEYELRLEQDFFGLLGLERGAEVREVKRAYFKLSKRFHPDRYFRRNVGEYGPRLVQIFKQISEAYELLSDPASRAEVEASMQQEERSARPAASDEARSDSRSEPSKPLTPIERLRQRMPFKIPEEIRQAKAAKGDDLFKAALISQKMGRLSEAASNMRLAVAFDPFNAEYKRAFGALQAEIALQQIDEMLGGPTASIGGADKREAQRLCKDALQFQPDDTSVLDRAARIHILVDQLDQAEEYIKRAVEIDPKAGGLHRTLAAVHQKRGNRGHAISELERALELDSGDAEARKMIGALKKNNRRVLNSGGTE